MRRDDFPLLKQRVNDKPLVYLDSAATTQKPESVIAAVSSYYSADNAGAHRGVHELSVRATRAYEGARDKVRAFINADDVREVVFVRSATEGINLVAQCYGHAVNTGSAHIGPGDEIVISTMEHHSNIVPWQRLCEKTGAQLRVIPMDDNGDLDLSAYRRLLNERTRIVAITHLSNVLGTVNPIKEMIDSAHEKNIPVLIDGAQAVARRAVDVQALDCDFYIFSGHKMYAPFGVGVVYGKKKWLEAMPPYQVGGGMISRVSFEKTEYAEVPHKFEAGTPNVAAAVGLGAAIDAITSMGIDVVAAHEQQLLDYTCEELRKIPGLRIIGQPRERASLVSFVLDDVHPHDVGTVLDHDGVAVRVGHHCCMPLMERLGLPATVRASFGIYNTHQDIDALVKGLHNVRGLFG